MAATKANLICAHCDKAINGLNGRYCCLLKRYVEYEKYPPCGNIKK